MPAAGSVSDAAGNNYYDVVFEIFREAGLRLPSAVGQTLAVVGGVNHWRISHSRRVDQSRHAGYRRKHRSGNLQSS